MCVCVRYTVGGWLGGALLQEYKYNEEILYSSTGLKLEAKKNCYGRAAAEDSFSVLI